MQVQNFDVYTICNTMLKKDRTLKKAFKILMQDKPLEMLKAIIENECGSTLDKVEQFLRDVDFEIHEARRFASKQTEAEFHKFFEMFERNGYSEQVSDITCFQLNTLGQAAVMLGVLHFRSIQPKQSLLTRLLN